MTAPPPSLPRLPASIDDDAEVAPDRSPWRSPEPISDAVVPHAAAAVSSSAPLWKRVVGFGWPSILVGAIAMAATYPGRTHGLGMVTEPLRADLGLADASGLVLYGALNFWGTLLGAAFCLPVGWLLDRYDRRLILAGNLLSLGVAVLAMAAVTGPVGLFLGILATRGLGQSALSVVSITIVAKAFNANRLGAAMAWYAILSAPFHLILIQGVGYALTDLDVSWRTAWGGVGIALIALAPVGWILRIPSGRIARPTASPSEKPTETTPPVVPTSVTGHTLAEALRTPAFWLFSGTISIWGMIYAGVALFNVDIFAERGFSQSLYFNVLSLVMIVALASKLVFGYVTPYVRLTHLLGICLVMTAASLAGLPFATQPWHAYLYGVGLGIASGAVALIFFAAWGTLYGQRDLGRIQGAAQMLTVFASAAGPLVISISKYATSSYTFIFLVFAGVVLMMAVAAFVTPLPRPKPSSLETT